MMLERYKQIIYKNKSEEMKVIDDCINDVIDLYPNIEPQRIRNSIINSEYNDINADYTFALLRAEGSRLFSIAVNKFGTKLWKNQAWKKSNCSKKCPFGSMCEKYLVKIDTEKFCYGQLMIQNIGEKELISLSKEHDIQIYKTNNDIYIDLNSDYDDQWLSGYFFECEWFIWWFGDFGDNNRKVNGYNVIPYL